ncbi:MAG: hypothetical protein ACYTBJ_19210 [Planctomycetota bacterium]
MRRYSKDGQEWSAEVYETKGQAHWDHAERLRKQAHRKREQARHMTVVGREGDKKAWLELEADALERKARALSKEGSDWVERSMELDRS